MDNPIYLQWQQWESRIQKWLSQPEDDFDLPDTTSFDRVILSILTVKYQVLYQDMDMEMESMSREKNNERISTVKLSKIKSPNEKEKEEHHPNKEKLFESFTGRFLTPEQVNNETSAEWQEFSELCEWHGLVFLQRFDKCLRQFVSELISITPAYQELIRQPAMISPVTKINNKVYKKTNEGKVFLSVDIKSANFSLLQYIHAIDGLAYPTWSDFLSVFVGSRPLLLRSKKLRMRYLGKLPEYYKLEALWTHYTATIYQKILCPCLDEEEVDVTCVALNGDEVVFQLDTSIEQEKIMSLVEHMQIRLTKESPIVKFLIQAYRLQAFHWKNKHMCFARVFIGQTDGQFDLKCVPDKDKNYEQAYADFQMFSNL